MPSVLDGFKSVTIVSANFTDSMVYRLLSGTVDFQGGSGSNVVIAMRLSKQRNNGSNLAHILERAMTAFSIMPRR
jgi:hypothetical protein